MALMVGSVFGLRLGRKIFANPEIDEVHRNIKKYIKSKKGQAKHPE